MRSLPHRVMWLWSTPLVVFSFMLSTGHVRGQTSVSDIDLQHGEVASIDCSPALEPSTTTIDKVPAGLSAPEWSSVCAAYDASRHAAFVVEDGYQARNPGQQWLIHFDGRGVSTGPDAGGWTWGLELERYGFAGAERDVCEPMHVSAQGQHVAYDWDATLQEWWVNDARGLEHGFTVHARPPQSEPGPLTITLAVRGDLQPRVLDGGRGVRFSSCDGADVLTYGGLVVLDADGQAVPACFEQSGAKLSLSIDERGARYPLTIDPIAQQTYLKASNTGADDRFGTSVSVSGDTIVIGAPFEDSNATGVNGNQANESAVHAGAAYVFVRNGKTWSQQAYLKASNPGPADIFGVSVSVSGDTVVIGAHGEDSNATGVNGNQGDDSVSDSGAVYVFVRSGTTWTQQAYFKASNPDANDAFGLWVSVSGDTVVVGAPSEDSSATGVNGNQADNSASSAGAAYVFVRSGATWSQEAYLKASNTGANDLFARALSVSGDTVVVAALDEDSNATGVNGNQADNSAVGAGAAYVFVRSGTSWSQQAYLKASNTQGGESFGTAVSVSGDTVVVGAINEDSNATGVNGNQADSSAYAAGAAYVFVRSGVTWSQQAYLKASNTDVDDAFGASLSLSANTVVIAAWNEDSNATGMNGNQADNSAFESGAAYVFVRSGTTWAQQAYLKASNTGAQDDFSQVSVSGDTVVVGAPSEDSSATGVNGNQADNSASTAGAVYVFGLPPGEAYCFGDGLDAVVTAACPCTNFGDAGHGCANSFSALGGLLVASGTTSPNTILITATELPNNNLTVGFRNTGNAVPGGVVFGDGVRCQSGTLIRFGAHNSGSGGDPANSWTSSATTVSPGLTRYYQVQYRNPSPSFCPPATFNITNGYRIAW